MPLGGPESDLEEWDTTCCARASALAVLDVVTAVLRNSAIRPTIARQHAPTRVERDVAARLQHLLNLPPTALDARLHARQRDLEHLGGVLLGHPLELGQRDRVAIGQRERRDEDDQVLSELSLGGPFLLFGWRSWEVVLACRGLGRYRMSGPLSAVIGEGASRQPIHPRAEPLRVAELTSSRLDSKVDVLQDVVDVVGVGSAARDERPELPLDFLPDAARARLDKGVRLLSSRSSSDRSTTDPLA